MIRVLKILPGTSVDGPGMRTSIYLAGCRHQCPGCHNPQSWDENGGTAMSIGEILNIVEENEMPVTLTGGDPLFQARALLPLCQSLKDKGINVWCYTGYKFEEILRDSTLSQLLPYIDVLVDGPFISTLRDTTLHFRGSSNQRLINIPLTLATSQIHTWTLPEDW